VTSESQDRRLMLCNTCGRYYWVSPTGHRDEWKVALATGETVQQIAQAEPTLEDVIRSVMEGVLETSWYMAEFFPTQVQASVDPLCHIMVCAAGDVTEGTAGDKLVETTLVLPFFDQ